MLAALTRVRAYVQNSVLFQLSVRIRKCCLLSYANIDQNANFSPLAYDCVLIIVEAKSVEYHWLRRSCTVRLYLSLTNRPSAWTRCCDRGMIKHAHTIYIDAVGLHDVSIACVN